MATKADMAELGRKGGEATKAKHGPEFYQRISAAGGKATAGKRRRRQSKKPRGRKPKPAAPKRAPAKGGVSLALDTLDAILADVGPGAE